MKKAMISQPMNGLSDETILDVKEKALQVLNEKGFEVINTLFSDEYISKEKPADIEIKNRPIYFLGKSLLKMNLCDAVYFCKGWENAIGCKIEHEVAKAYGLEIIYEE